MPSEMNDTSILSLSLSFCFVFLAVAHLISVLPIDCSKYAEDFAKNCIGKISTMFWKSFLLFFSISSHSVFCH